MSRISGNSEVRNAEDQFGHKKELDEWKTDFNKRLTTHETVQGILDRIWR